MTDNWPKKGQKKGQQKICKDPFQTINTKEKQQFYDLFMKMLRNVSKHCGLC